MYFCNAVPRNSVFGTNRDFKNTPKFFNRDHRLKVIVVKAFITALPDNPSLTMVGIEPMTSKANFMTTQPGLVERLSDWSKMMTEHVFVFQEKRD